MKKRLLSVIVGGILLSGCQSTDMISEIKESEDVILKEDASPLVIEETVVQEAKEEILSEGGFISISEIKDIPQEDLEFIKNQNLVNFKFDSFDLSEESKKNIDKHIDFLTTNNMIKVIVEGHTDEKGEKSYNLTLGEKRAKSVKDYMISKGIKAERVEIISYGETKPVDKASNKEAWQKNRRSVLVYN